MKVVENQKLDMERALYGSQDILVKNCVFDGPADGESALKESSHASGMSGCKNSELPHYFSGIRMVCKQYRDDRHQRTERVFYDAF